MEYEMGDKFKGSGTVAHVGKNRNGDPYARILATTGHQVYLELGLVTTWPGFKPGMVVDPREGDTIEFVCKLTGHGLAVVEVTGFQPLSAHVVSGFIKRKDYRYDEPITRGRGRHAITRKRLRVWVQFLLYEEGRDEFHCAITVPDAKRSDFRLEAKMDRLNNGDSIPVKFEIRDGEADPKTVRFRQD